MGGVVLRNSHLTLEEGHRVWKRVSKALGSHREFGYYSRPSLSPSLSPNSWLGREGGEV